jgi:hypothetical protein
MDMLSVASLGFGLMDAYGEKKQAEGAADAMEASAGLYDLQAQAIIANAEFAVRRGEEQGRREMGTYIARFAKAGVRFEGTPAISIAESERNIRLDMLATRLNAAAKANELGFAGMNQRIGANFARMNAANDFNTGILKLGAKFAINNWGGDKLTTSGGRNIPEETRAFNRSMGIKSSARRSGYTF